MFGEVKAVVMVEPGWIEVNKFPYPDVPSDAALLKVEMSGICGTDKHMYSGEIIHPGRIITPFPIIPGHENVGVIAEIGEEAAGRMEGGGFELKEGDKVVAACDVLCGECYWCKHVFGYPWCENWIGYGTTISCKEPPHLFGGWAEYMYILPKTFLFKVPQDLTLEAAVLTEPMAVAYGSLIKASSSYSLAFDVGGFGAGNTVVVQGPGPLGLCHAVMAKIMGAENIVAVGSGSEEDRYRLNLAKELNIIDDGVNATDPKERVKDVLRLIGGKGADLVIECAGAPPAVIEGLEMLRKGGTFLELGNFIDKGITVPLNPAVHICSKNARIIDITGMPYPAYGSALKVMQRYNNKIPFEKLVTHKFRLEEAERAMKTAINGRCLKVVITP